MNELRIGCLLRQVNAGLIQYGKEHAEELELTPAQSMMLEYLFTQKEEEYCLTDICMETQLSKATVSIMLKALRKKGYVNVKADSEDDRKKKIALTQKAYETREAVEESLKRRSECIHRDISEQELRELEKTLNKMVLNLKQTIDIDKEEKIW